jgi:hypothetical protein
MTELIRMIRGDEFPAPHQADVHPEEVTNYLAGGWVIDPEWQDDDEDDPRQIYRGFPNNRLDAGELGLILFDEDGVALVTPEQAKWLDDAIAEGLLGEPKAESSVSEPMGENTTTEALEEEAHTQAPPAIAGEEASASLAAPAGGEAEDGANNPLPTDTDDTQRLGTGEPPAGDPAGGTTVDAKAAEDEAAAKTAKTPKSKK